MIASVDAGLHFERALDRFGDGWTQTLEPRLYYLRVPYRDQDNLRCSTPRKPRSASASCSSNRFIGADRQMDANNLTVALTSRVLDAGGSERLSASIGQIRYFDDQRVQLPGRPATDHLGSTWSANSTCASTTAGAPPRQPVEPEQRPHRPSSIGVQNRFGREGVVNLAYRFRRDFLEYVDGSLLLPISGAWRFVARWNYSLRDDTTLEAFAGIEHDSCCVAWRARPPPRCTVEGEASNALTSKSSSRASARSARRPATSCAGPSSATSDRGRRRAAAGPRMNAPGLNRAFPRGFTAGGPRREPARIAVPSRPLPEPRRA